MSDRAPVTVTIYECPADKVGDVLDILETYGLYETLAPDGALVLGLDYIDPEGTLGLDGDIATALGELAGVTAVVNQEAKYDFNGTTHLIVASLGTFESIGGQSGEVLLSAADIDRLMGDRYLTLREALNKFTGKAHRDAIDAASTHVWTFDEADRTLTRE